MKKFLSFTLALCMLMSICMVTVSAATTGIEIPENAVLVHHEDCTSAEGWAFSGSAKIVNGVYGISGNGVQLYAKNATATYTLPTEAQFGKNAIITLQFYSQAVDHNFRVGFGGAYFGGNYRAVRNGKNYMTMITSDSGYTYNAGVQSIGWHELAGVIDETGHITYYIDGVKLTDAQSTKINLAEGRVVSYIDANIPGWNSTTQGALADIKVYHIPTESNITEFSVAGTPAVIDEDEATVTANVSEILRATATYTLKSDGATLDIAQNAVITNGQVIKYTDGEKTKEYTVILNKTPFPGIEIPAEATLVLTEDCTDTSGWTFTGTAGMVDGAYGFDGIAAKSSAIENHVYFTLPEEAQLSKNAIVTLKFYSAQANHAYAAGFDLGTICAYIGGRYAGVTYDGNYAFWTKTDANERVYGNSGIALGVGWHELAAVIDNTGSIAYYVDGNKTGQTVASGNKFADGEKLEGISGVVFGWIEGYEGAIADIKVYSVPAPNHTVTFDLGKFGTTEDETVLTVKDGEVPEEPEVTAKDGYAFEGWDKEIAPATEDVTYTAKYIITGTAPVLTGVKLLGEEVVGKTLSIDYDYSGEADEGESIYAWYINGNKSSRFTTKEITVTFDMYGKEIRGEVVPCDNREIQGDIYTAGKVTVTGDAVALFNAVETAQDAEIVIKAFGEEIGIGEAFDGFTNEQKLNLYAYFKNAEKNFASKEDIKAAFEEFAGDPGNGENDEITMMRYRYYTYLAGSDEKLKYADAMQETAASRDASVKTYLEKLVPEGENLLERERVFTDIIPERSYQGGRALQAHFDRLKTMAQAYKDCYSAYYNDRELLESIISVLSWLTYAKAPDGYAWYGAETWDYYYDRNNPRAASPMSKANWWQLEVGIPLADTQLIALVFDELETYAPQLKEDALMTLDTFVPDPEVSSGGISGANGAWANKMVILTSILRGNPPITEEQLANPRYFNAEKTDKLRACKNRLENQIFYTTGNGYHTDGSYVDHNYYAYTGGYGHNMWISLIELEYLLTGTSYELSEEKSSILRNWTFDSMEPFIYKSKMYLDMVRGREVGMGNGGIGNPDIGVRLLMQAEAAEGETRDRLISLAKYIAESVCEGRGTNVISSGSACFDPKLMNLMADESVVSRGEVDRSQIFPDMCRIVHYRDNYGIGLPFYDKRIYTHEDGGDFSVGWNTGSGMIWLYNDDITQYTGDYWPTVNAYRMAGTTVSKNTKKGGANGSDHAGGATVDIYTVAAFEQAHPDVTMRAQKSYFLFDDEIVMLGSGISSSDEPTVETIVENRKIRKDNSDVLTVNGKEVIPSVGDAEVIENVSWAQLSGIDDIGYYFPDGAQINAERYEGSGTWSSISKNNQINNTTVVTNKYVSMWFDHGVNPENATYSYALLPGKTAAEVEAYAKSPAYEVLANNEKVQGVYHSGLDILAANFWADEETDFAGKITSDKKASVIMQKKDGITTIGVSDPARENTGKIRLHFTGLYSVISKDDRVEVVSCGADGIVVDVDVSGANGQTVTFVAADSDSEITGLPLVYDFEDGEIHADVKANSDNSSVTNVTVPGTETKAVKIDVKKDDAVKTYRFEGENGLDAFVAESGRLAATLSTECAHSGAQSVKFTAGAGTYNQSLSFENGNYIAEVWVYDPGVKATGMVAAGGVYAGLYGAMNNNYYLTREGTAWSATTVKRTAGWHKFTFDASSGTDTKVYIDDVLVKTSTKTQFGSVAFFDWWNNGNQGNVYFDDLTLTNTNPAPVEMTVNYDMPFITARGEYTLEADLYTDYNGEEAIYPFVIYQNSETELVAVGVRGENVVLKTAEGNTVIGAKIDGKNTVKAQINTDSGTFDLYLNGTKVLANQPFCHEAQFVAGVKSVVTGTEATFYVDNVKMYVEDGFIKGDIDGDGKIAITDAVKGLKIVAGTENGDDKAIKAADIDGNGKVSITDIVTILKFVARIIPSL